MRYESYGKAIGPPARRCRSVGKTLRNAFPGRSTMAKCTRNAFPGVRRWQDCALMRSWPDWQWQYTRAMRSRVPCRDKIPPRCVPGRLPMAKYSRNAFPGGNPWQVLRSMHPKSGLGRENRQFAARFARHASEMSWFWQDMRAMHPKSPANRLSGTHRAKILPGRPPFRCTGPRIMHGAQILPSSDAWPFGDETPSLKDGMLRFFRFGGAGSGIPV